MIDSKTVEHIAKLSRLQIDSGQAHEYSAQLTKILEYFHKISALSTNGVEPLVTPTQIENFWREDEVKSEFKAEDMTQNAPAKQGHLFKVPPVV